MLTTLRMDLMCDSPEPHEEHLSKRQKITDFEKEDFENKLTAPIALEFGEESRDLELKLLDKCLASHRCDIAQPAKCQCRCCLYTKYGHVAFVPHDAHQDDEYGPGEKCEDCISVEVTVRGQLAVEISDHLPLSPEVRHDLACHFRVFREILSRMFSTKIQDLRKRMAQVKIESMPTLQEEMLELEEEVAACDSQLDELRKELARIFETMVTSGVDISGRTNDLPMTHKKTIPTLAHLGERDVRRTRSLEEEMNKVNAENSRLAKRVQHLEEENTKFKGYDTQTAPIQFYASSRESKS
ncbi:hypothetical protein EYC80_001056 [Monilinia laxa]|uniref:Uncharacterized protein n=1 Tax=Monilinia laxa TaxID=61186 RepID=A0A5N6K7Y9_MONLA|nr:hypothetical protein EYC80_001056 [Monilinia laxa]